MKNKQLDTKDLLMNKKEDIAKILAAVTKN